MEFRILGPVEVLDAGLPVALGGNRDRAVLAGLLLEAGRPVSVGALADAVWDDPPPTAAKQVRNAVARLRALLQHRDLADVIETAGAGYRIRLGRGELDAAGFAREAATAGTAAAAGDAAAAVEAWNRALALWRGPALDGLCSRALRAQAARLDEQCLGARLARAEQQLATGDHEAAAADLIVLSAKNPLQERPAGLLMHALHRGGRTADALAVYHRLRKRLAAETGLDPSAETRQIYQRILMDETVPVPPEEAPRPAASATAPGTPAAAIPAQLPADVRFFSGRAEHVALLDELLDQGASGVDPIVISAIDGTAGIGKTVLAVHWAHRVADRFPDGQLYVNLRGFDPSDGPMPPAEAARRFLDAFGIGPDRLPHDPDAQLAIYRRVLAGKRVLILLDNALDAEQVRPLLPRAPGPLVLVTSRRLLAGLAVAEGATPITVDLLSPAEARDLLCKRISERRAAAEPEALEEIAQSCARLPLALSIAGAYTAAHGTLPLAEVAEQLRDVSRRLDVLDTGDPVTTVRTVFSWSYHRLDDSAARMFSLLGVAPGPDIGLPAAAALVGASQHETHSMLSALVRASMLTETAASRYAFHDLLRAYALERVQESPDERREALLRMLDHYLHSAYASERLLFPARDPLDLAVPHPGAAPWNPRTADEARAWIERELPTLLAAARTAADEGLAAHAWQIPWTLETYFGRRGRWHDWQDTYIRALAAAEAAGDVVGCYHAHRGLGRVQARLGEFTSADRHIARALDLARDSGNHLAQARALTNRAWLFELTGQAHNALAAAQEALELFDALDHPVGRAEVRNTVGWYLALTGDYANALTHCEQALGLLRPMGHRLAEAGTLDSIGYIHHCKGNHAAAADAYKSAIDLFAEIGDRTYEAGTTVRLGDTLAAAGDHATARATWRRALQMLEELDHPDKLEVRARLEKG